MIIIEEVIGKNMQKTIIYHHFYINCIALVMSFLTFNYIFKYKDIYT